MQTSIRSLPTMDSTAALARFLLKVAILAQHTWEPSRMSKYRVAYEATASSQEP